ncbi:T9SS type A sorting domain-containing protein [Labilibacter sediminis]|nr:T9SS type A sorting domain-containing protein [Labilibacter sediminis]
MRITVIIILSFIPFILSAQKLEDRINALLDEMSLEEKVYQLTHDTYFSTGTNTRLNIPGFIMSDGPHGVRFGGATSFPVGIAMASTFNTQLIEDVGEAMAEEFWAYGKHQLLGPCIDLCRDPRNGRSAETAGEDPFLAGEIGAAYVKGIQKTPVVATVKHFNLVNRQDYRHSSNVTINERMLMEHYGENFRKTIQEGGALSVMNAYNLINGVHCSESPLLLDTILRQRWGFPFYVVSDWGAVYNAKNALLAGTEICMASDHYANDLPALVNSGQITTQRLDSAVSRVLKTKLLNGMLDYYPRANNELINSQEHRDLCRLAGQEAMILFKNENNILPVQKDQVAKIAVIGPNASVMQTDGFGSSWVDVIYSVSPLEGIQNAIGASKVDYVQGCEINSTSTAGFSAALNAAGQADYVIYVGGLDKTQEGEGYGEGGDRKSGSVDLPGVQQDLINALAAQNENLIVVINSGGVCGLNRSIQNIKGLIYGFYPGQEGGNAIADVIFGDYNPAGRLPVTMPVSDAQIQPQNDNFNDDLGGGYRWYDKRNIVPEFAFGFGLSYTTFSYSNISIAEAVTEIGKPITITADVSNTGDVDGQEVVQLYLALEATELWMPKKELKGFKRIHLQAGETKRISFTLSPEDMYYWNTTSDNYYVKTGNYSVMIGGSSDNLPLSTQFELQSSTLKPDLKITRVFTLPRYPVEGDQVQFFALVKNMGTEATKVGDVHHVQFLVDGQEVDAGLSNTISIPAGGMQLISSDNANWVVPSEGTYEVKANVNSEGQIQELNILNNTAELLLTAISEETLILSKNLALNKPITSSSNEGGDLSASNAVDGNSGTRWSSLWSDPQVLTIDLEELYEIKKISIQWETAYANEYKVELSVDGQVWEEVIYESNGDGGKDEWMLTDPAYYRYVKLTGLQRATEWGYSIYELEVFGTAQDQGTYVKEISTTSLYPNPATHVIHVNGNYGVEEVYIYDMSGRLVKSAMLVNGQLNVTGLVKGIYWLKIEEEYHKFIKK